MLANVDDTELSSMCIMRTILGLGEAADAEKELAWDDQKARIYATLEEEDNDLLQRLRKRVKGAVVPEHLREFELQWHSDGILANENHEEHLEYVRKLSHAFLAGKK